MKNLLKKIVAAVVAVTLVTSPVRADFFSDFCGAIFTILTAPIALIAPDNPTLRKNNPFRKKLWEEEQKEEERFLRLARNKFSLRPMQEIADNMEILDENFDTLKNNFLYFREHISKDFETISNFIIGQNEKNKIISDTFKTLFKKTLEVETNLNDLQEALLKYFEAKENKNKPKPAPEIPNLGELFNLFFR